MWIKDPGDTLTFKFDWAPLENGTGNSNWLDRTSSPLETISSQTTTSIDSPGPTIESSSITDSNTTVTVSISGGTAGNKYQIKNTVTTSTGQIAEKTVILYVTQR